MLVEDILQPKPDDRLVEDLMADQPSGKTLSGGALDTRAFQFDLAFGDETPGYDTLKKDIVEGREDELRLRLAALEDEKSARNAVGLALSTVASGIPADPKLVAELAVPQATNPTTVLEKKVVETAIDANVALSNNSRVQETLASGEVFGPELPEIEKNGVIRTILQTRDDALTEVEKQRGWLAWGIGEAAQLAEFPSWWNVIRDPGNEDIQTSSYLPGSNLLERANKLWALEPNEFAAALDSELAALSAVNISDARRFLDVVKHRSDTDALVSDAMFLTAIPAAKAAKGAAKVVRSVKGGSSEAVKEALSATKDIAKAAGEKYVEPTDVVAAAGNIEEAARLKAWEKIAENMVPGGSDMTKKKLSQVFKNIPGMFDPTFKFADAPEYAKKYADDIVKNFQRQATLITRAIGQNATIATLPPKALEATFQAAEKEVASKTKGLADYIKGTTVRYMPDDNLGVGQVETTFGTETGLFKSAEDALQAAEHQFALPDNSYLIKQEGTGYSIKFYKDVSETGDATIDDAIQTSAKSSFQSWFGDTVGTALKSMLSPKTKLDEFQQAQRLALVTGQTSMEAAVRELARPIETLYNLTGKKGWKEFQTMLNIGRTTLRDPSDPTSMGLWYNTVGELGEAWMMHMKRVPTSAEVDAYYAYKQLSDVDYLNRSILLWKQGVKTGHRAYEFKAFTGEGQKISFYVEGKRMDTIPHANVEFIEVYMDGSNKTKNFSKLKGKERKAFETDLASGAVKLIRRRNPDDASLQMMTGNDADPVLFVAVRDVTETPLRLDKQLNYNPGGHVVYKNSHYVKAPNIVDGEYKGDRTLFAADSADDAADKASKLQQAMKMYENKDPGLDAYLRSNLPWTPEEFKKLYQRGMLKKGMRVAGVRQGELTTDAGVRFASGKYFTDEYKELNTSDLREYADAYRSSKEYAQPKSARLKQIVKDGTEDKPLWKLEDAALVNPVQTQVAAMGGVIRSALYEDYQFQAARSWIEEFGNAQSNLAAGLKYNGKQLSLKELRQNPLFYLKNADIALTNPLRAEQARQIRQSILNLVGTPSKTALQLDTYKNMLIDGKMGKYIPDKAIPFIRDPFSYARAVAFHTKLGLFNPVQLFVQMNTLVNAMAISPLSAAKAAPSVWLMMMTKMTQDPKIIEHFGTMSQKMLGLDQASFVDARKWMDHFALDTIGKEFAWLDDVSDPELFRGKTGKLFLDKGPMLFNFAERAVRTQAFLTAYTDFIKLNPKKAGKLSIADAKQVLLKSQPMFANMTRDANAWWQRGITGNFSQFFGYPTRMMELMLGKQLTAAEKARLIGMQLTLYGAAPAAGIYTAFDKGDFGAAVAAVNPFDEDIRTYALKKGYNLDEGTVGYIYNGITAMGLSAGFEYTTGKPLVLNVGERYGVAIPQVGQTIADNFRDHGVWSALAITATGASGSIAADILRSASPVIDDLVGMANGNGSPLTVPDILNATREISTSNQAHRLAAALMGTAYLSKTGSVINADQDQLGEAFKAFTGLEETSVGDAFKMISAQKERKEMLNDIRKRVRQIRGYMRDAAPEDRLRYRKEVEALVQSYSLLPSEMKSILRDTGPEGELDDEIRKDFEKQFQEQ